MECYDMSMHENTLPQKLSQNDGAVEDRKECSHPETSQGVDGERRQTDRRRYPDRRKTPDRRQTDDRRRMQDRRSTHQLNQDSPGTSETLKAVLDRKTNLELRGIPDKSRLISLALSDDEIRFLLKPDDTEISPGSP